MFIGEYDYATDIAVQRDEAFEEGVESGRAEGEAIGERNKALETARVLLNSGVSLKIISRSTGLTEEEIHAL